MKKIIGITISLSIAVGLGYLFVTHADENILAERAQKILTIPVLTYHEVMEDSQRWSDLQVPIDAFYLQMDTLREAGYTPILFEDLHIYTTERSEYLPEKPILITFDDTSKTLIKNVLPILNEYNFVATFFINSDWINQNENFLTWDDIRTLAASGMEIGGHTANHTELTSSTSLQQLQEMVLRDKETIESELGFSIHSFSYPANTYTNTLGDYLQQIGYTSARTGLNNTDNGIFKLSSFVVDTRHSRFVEYMDSQKENIHK